MNVPFVDLALQYRNLKPEIDRAVSEVLSSGRYIGGEVVRNFETQFATKTGARHGVAIGNATDGLFLSLKALGIGPGDEVITPAWSWISTSEVISLCGATPVFADVDPDYFTLTADSVARKVTQRTKAIILVHLYGQVADVNGLLSLCRKQNLFLIEDCSQAHFSKAGDRFAGTFGDSGIFSFYPTKNLGAYGDAGCVITNEESLAIKIRRWANHGGLSKDEHLMEGFNSRMDALQAALLSVKLKFVEAWNRRRQTIAQVYFHQLADVKNIRLPVVRQGTDHTFHLFVIKARRRDELRLFLEKGGVQTMIHYPQALPFEPSYKYLQHKPGDFPVSYSLAGEVLSLPVYPELREEQILHVCKLIKSFYD
jgi:dTDP-4-amino-4,6-dideoxygalactose transaminase